MCHIRCMCSSLYATRSFFIRFVSFVLWLFFYSSIHFSMLIFKLRPVLSLYGVCKRKSCWNYTATHRHGTRARKREQNQKTEETKKNNLANRNEVREKQKEAMATKHIQSPKRFHTKTTNSHR